MELKQFDEVRSTGKEVLTVKLFAIIRRFQGCELEGNVVEGWKGVHGNVSKRKRGNISPMSDGVRL